MRFCDRCGIELESGTWCADCAEVEGLPAQAVTRLVPRRGYYGYQVYSSRRRGTLPPAEREAIERMVVELTAQRFSANEIAIRAGVSTRTVHRVRVRLGVVVPHSTPIEHVRDWDAFQAGMAQRMRQNRRTA